MAWKYVQRTGGLLQNSTLIDTGYSGKGAGKNNPDEQCITDEGPIPRGWWTIGPATDTGPTKLSLPLTPDGDTCGRSGFFIHGDSISNPGSASHGCVIMKKSTRQQIDGGDDKRLQVVSESSLDFRKPRTARKKNARRKATRKK
jgi:hypothetical protein